MNALTLDELDDQKREFLMILERLSWENRMLVLREIIQARINRSHEIIRPAA